MKEFQYPISVLQNQLSYLHIGITHSVFGIIRGKTSFLEQSDLDLDGLGKQSADDETDNFCCGWHING